MVTIFDNNKEFRFPERIESDVVLENLLEKTVNEKYYLTNSSYVEKDDKRIFKHKNRDDIEYEIDMDKYFIGDVCEIDKHTKFAISSRIFSIYGNYPILTARNTADNSKIVVESKSE